MPYKTILLTFVAIFFASASQAVDLSYSLSSSGGSTYVADFTVINNSSGAPIEELIIYFAPGEYQNISVTKSPADWDPLAIEPDAGGAALANWLVFGSGIGAGAMRGEFSVQFDYLLADGSMPGSWSFEIIDPYTFDILESGMAVQAISVPAAAWPFIGGLACLLTLFRRYPASRWAGKSDTRQIRPGG